MRVELVPFTLMGKNVCKNVFFMQINLPEKHKYFLVLCNCFSVCLLLKKSIIAVSKRKCELSTKLLLHLPSLFTS